ncbi:MAG: siroheme synthase CysG [Gammaproteobacteria bacterium]|nr:siroheme synthase CysG [Gammaproteobacteria bacterium]MDE0440670.1 siroheme synthase CysG [Gammaproteobacteria bacterium]
MSTLPLALKLASQPCLVVGGGEVARRKIETLLATGASVEVVATSVDQDLRERCRSAGIAIRDRPFEERDVVGRVLVVAATGDAAVNRAVQQAGAKHHVLVNCVDDAEHSTALFPAVVNRGPVTVGISTEGTSPTLARRLRERIEALLPDSVGPLARYLGSRRNHIKAALADTPSRQRFWDQVLDSELADAVGRGDLDAAEETLDSMLAAAPSPGIVSLVGAGPGDPDLLTLKALHRLQRADVIYHDKLVGAAILDRCRRDSRRIDVGRRSGDGLAVASRQALINDRLERDARRGLRVVRLKGGDPLVFGRGGEEIEALVERGVPFEVVPGVTAGLGCAAVAGIPLTHRRWAQSVRFVTGQVHQGADPDWPELAKPGQTLVVYMGLGALVRLCDRLMGAGAAPTTPAAAISKATLPGQRMVVGSIGDLGALVRAAALEGPVTTIIGRVASFARTSQPQRQVTDFENSAAHSTKPA